MHEGLITGDAAFERERVVSRQPLASNLYPHTFHHGRRVSDCGDRKDDVVLRNGPKLKESLLCPIPTGCTVLFFHFLCLLL